MAKIAHNSTFSARRTQEAGHSVFVVPLKRLTKIRWANWWPMIHKEQRKDSTDGMEEANAALTTAVTTVTTNCKSVLRLSLFVPSRPWAVLKRFSCFVRSPQ